MTLTFLDVYNKVAEQAWSMFDGEVEDEDEFEGSLRSSIQKAMADLWCRFPYPFRYAEHNFTTVSGTKSYDSPDGNIIEKTVENQKKYSVVCNGNYLEFIEDYASLPDETGTPTKFYLKNDKVYLHPMPDAEYSVDIEFLTLVIGKNAGGEDIFELKNDSDVIAVSKKYEVLFKNALITLSMQYAIASPTNQNYSSYQAQADSAYKTLVKYTKGIEKNSRIGW